MKRKKVKQNILTKAKNYIKNNAQGIVVTIIVVIILQLISIMV